jgi:signal transduction histidine kinase
MLSFCGDEKSLCQLVSILLDNALKYSPEHGKILLLLEKQGRNIQLLVENTVTEMETQNLNLLFDRFYRADKSRNSQIGGYGIGLSIAKAIVTTHKGKISATAQDENHVLRITVTFPG